jgi:hypothetical protein
MCNFTGSFFSFLLIVLVKVTLFLTDVNNILGPVFYICSPILMLFDVEDDNDHKDVINLL